MVLRWFGGWCVPVLTSSALHARWDFWPAGVSARVRVLCSMCILLVVLMFGFVCVPVRITCLSLFKNTRPFLRLWKRSGAGWLVAPAKTNASTTSTTSTTSTISATSTTSTTSRTSGGGKLAQLPSVAGDQCECAFYASSPLCCHSLRAYSCNWPARGAHTEVRRDDRPAAAAAAPAAAAAAAAPAAAAAAAATPRSCKMRAGRAGG